MIRAIVKWIFRILLVYLLYAIISGFLVFLFIQPRSDKKTEETSTGRFYGEEIGPDQVAVIEDRELFIPVRVNLVESAQASLKVAYFSIADGVASDFFYGELLEAADRGVQVELLYDGKGLDIFGDWNIIYWTLIDHPNIDVRFYEPFDWMRPWTWQNRMHDKFLIVDDNYVLTGGVNMEDRFLIENHDGEVVFDRDIVIHNSADNVSESGSVVNDYLSYFNELWTHTLTNQEDYTVPETQQAEADETYHTLLQHLRTNKEADQYNLNQKIDWEELMHPTQKISLVTNGIQRWKKDPKILLAISSLFEQAEERAIVQSPYLIPSTEIQSYVELETSPADFIYLTNSVASSPNPFGMAGQRKYLDELLQHAAQLYEYQGEGSIHAKAYVIDDRLSLIGSFNFDPRSAFLSTENLIVINSEPFAETLTKNIKNIVLESTPAKQDGLHLTDQTKEPKHVPWYKEWLIKFLHILLYPFEDLL